MLRLKTITPFILTAALAACGGGAEEAADHEMSDAEMASAPVMESSSGCFLQGATMEETAQRPSPLRTTDFTVGGTSGVVCYGSPAANGREIMGGLVPYGELWRMGANEATGIHLDGPATIGGVSLAAGSYSVYALPNAGEWQLFLNSNYQRWGIPISDEVRTTEVGSFTVTPEATGSMVESLTFSFSGGELIAEWENTRIRIPVAAATAGM